MVRYRVLVSGRVQGVSFRAACQRAAWQRGVAGWVRNLDDGRVEAVFEGDPDGVQHLLDWARRGPGLAVVDEIDVRPEEPEGLAAFIIT